MRSEPQGRAYTGLPSHGKPLSSAAHKPLFTLLSDKRDRRRTEMQPVFPQHEASMMEDSSRGRCESAGACRTRSGYFGKVQSHPDRHRTEYVGANDWDLEE